MTYRKVVGYLLVKCQWCKEKDTDRDEMKKVVVGTKTKSNKYYHVGCYEKYLKDKEFKEKEAKELDQLYETVKRIHNMDTVPSGLFYLLQDLRNGTIRKNGVVIKKFKNGIQYRYIDWCYKYCEDEIRKWQRIKDFGDDKNGELRYCFSIVSSNIENAARDYKTRLNRKKKNEQSMKQVVKEDTNKDTFEEIKVINKVKHTDEMDISDLL